MEPRVVRNAVSVRTAKRMVRRNNPYGIKYDVFSHSFRASDNSRSLTMKLQPRRVEMPEPW
jgi:hypothetical protein